MLSPVSAGMKRHRALTRPRENRREHRRERAPLSRIDDATVVCHGKGSDDTHVVDAERRVPMVRHDHLKRSTDGPNLLSWESEVARGQLNLWSRPIHWRRAAELEDLDSRRVD